MSLKAVTSSDRELSADDCKRVYSYVEEHKEEIIHCPECRLEKKEGGLVGVRLCKKHWFALPESGMVITAITEQEPDNLSTGESHEPRGQAGCH